MKSMAGNNVNTSNSQIYHLFSLFENDILAGFAKGHYVRYWPFFFFFFFNLECRPHFSLCTFAPFCNACASLMLKAANYALFSSFTDLAFSY